MKVLVTGGYGFIGSFVAERFFNEGCAIYILDNLTTGKVEFVDFPHTFFHKSVENEDCERIFKDNQFDIVIHLAAQVDVQFSIENPLKDSQTNILGLTHMLHLSSKYNVRKFVFASSAAVYGDNDKLPLKENTACKPISLYGINKKIGEYYCEKWKDVYNLDTLCFRFSNVYGPRQGTSGEGGVVSIFANRLINEKPFIVFGDGLQTRDFIYVKDVADAIYLSIKKNISGVYNLSSNMETSVNEMIDIFYKTALRRPRVHYQQMRAGDILYSRLDNTMLKQFIEWVPQYSLKSGIKETYEWFVRNSK